MSKKLILVTGASRGIGLEILMNLANNNDFVVGTATSKTGVEKINEICKKNNLLASGCILDLNDEHSMQGLLDYCKKTYDLPIQILINNAGITSDNLALRMKKSEWEQVINTNLTGVFNLTQKILRPMMKAKWGRIINISSIIGSTGNPGQANYAASKAGLLGFSKSLALELATRGITVNSISPGFIQTEMTDKLSVEQKQSILEKIPMKRIGSPKDVAELVKFLSSEHAGYITGSNIHINGGMFMA